MTDIEIAQSCTMRPITEIADAAGVERNYLELYGNYKAKVDYKLLRENSRPDGKLILVTAINPTPAGEGKTTTSVGLADGLRKIGKNAVAALREPSLGPVFGIKGGAAGGGYAQVVPMEDINLHFTGDMHAIGAANNLLCAMIDNHMQQGNALEIDPRRIIFTRVVDMNDRALRNIIVGMGGSVNGVPREDHYMITVASEVMAILCLATSLSDLKKRCGDILVAYRYDGSPVFARDLKVDGAMCALLKDAIKPNLVQTLDGSPCLMHGGPFANIAHGCNSIVATRLALKLADYTITEAGFGADLGAEKFFDIKCRKAGFKPDCAVIVATIRALKYNGGVPKEELNTENLNALKAGCVNLQKHIENIGKFHVPVVVAINRFPSDTDDEIEFLRHVCEDMGARYALSEVFTKGADGGMELAQMVIEEADSGKSQFQMLYPDEMPLKEKIETIAREIYGADGVTYSPSAEMSLKAIESLGYGNLPVCMAKTQYSLTDDPKKLGRPTGFNINIRTARVSAGAGFVVCETGKVMTMPGLPRTPSAFNIDVDADGKITGLF